MNNEQLKTILEKHQEWLNGEAGGERANLAWANLVGADLSHTKGILGFYLGQHFGYAWRNKDNQIVVKIGCQESEIGEMIKGANALGVSNNYSPDEVALYIDVLRSIKKRGLKE